MSAPPRRPSARARSGLQALEAHGYVPGSSVLIEELPGGELRIMPTDQVRDRIRGVGRRIVEEHEEALQILADHDPEPPRP